MSEKKLYKIKSQRKICGVCAGAAEYLNIDVSIIRIIWAACVLFAGTGLFLYIIAAIILPEKNEEL
ncbi:MAG: PspC domain-containing protein [Clostridiales bacterium]|jgi:phage shock protein PspC (stress-responsive transcriptional regulator)|nr:PspC domain-containing protein [Clostridiales bacterium]